MITGDFHIHTVFSTDSDGDVRKTLDSAIEKGIKTVCITDHWDEDYPEAYAEPGELGEDLFRFDRNMYFRELEKLKEEYEKKLDLRIGVEIGLQPHLGAFYQEMVKQHPYDFVIGSVHLVNGEDPYYKNWWEQYEDGQMYQKTFEETVCSLKQIEDFDVLGHIDYIVRYGRWQAEAYSYERFRDVLDEILKRVIDSGKGIELNTAGWKYGLDFCHPHPDVLLRYRELGGEIITVGSDAHKPEHVAYDFKRAEEVLKMCGYTYYTQYRNRKPEFLKI